jgi:hypothetical protein
VRKARPSVALTRAPCARPLPACARGKRRGDGSRRAAGAIRPGYPPMLSFAVTGAIGCVLTTVPDELTLAVSSVLERDGEPSRVAWVLCVSREPELRAKILESLRDGDIVRIEGEIEQRRRQVGELAFHSVGFVIRSIERLPPPTEGATP